MHFRLNGLALVVILMSFGFPLYAQEATPQETASPDAAPDTPLPAFPNNCEALPLVGGEGSEVTKEISPPAVNIPLPGPLGVGTRNNWNTDWYIPSGKTYASFSVIFMPRNDQEYNVEMYLKFPDDSTQQFYNEQRTSFTVNEPITVNVTPDRSDVAPYQVNAEIGGIQAVGARYTVAVAGCN